MFSKIQLFRELNTDSTVLTESFTRQIKVDRNLILLFRDQWGIRAGVSTQYLTVLFCVLNVTSMVSSVFDTTVSTLARYRLLSRSERPGRRPARVVAEVLFMKSGSEESDEGREPVTRWYLPVKRSRPLRLNNPNTSTTLPRRCRTSLLLTVTNNRLFVRLR